MSPIRKSEAARYPKNWKEIRARIMARADGRCECQGECGLHPPKPLPRRCVERHGEPAIYAKSPENCADDNLKAMCQRCHLRYDVPQHQENAAATRRAAKQNRELFP